MMLDLKILNKQHKNKVMLERNSRRLSNIHSKESDEVIKQLRSKKNDTEKAIQETDIGWMSRKQG